MRILITGIGGFVGHHLVRHLVDTISGVELYGAVIEPTPDLDTAVIAAHVVDLRDPDSTTRLLERVQPERIYHLAAQASVSQSFEAPWETLENNIRGQLNLIQGCLTLGLTPRILIISSGEIYGSVRPEDLPVSEDAPLRPPNPYSVSKVAQDMMGLQYFLSHRLPIMRARPFNHFGPGQRPGFVVPDFARQVAMIETQPKRPTEVKVGNLSARRDFTDVRDIVRAYRLIMEAGTPGEVYNVASGATHSIQEVLDTLLSYAHREIAVQVDEALKRPVDIPIICGDSTRLRQATGWQPTIPFEQTLLDVLNDYRQRVQLST